MFGLLLAGDDYLVDIGTPAAYARAEREWEKRKSAEACI
jgi:NDP-sugar pyrophosphorylase family protein